MPTLDTYRKHAKLLLRWHRERNYSIGEKVRRLDRYREFNDREALALPFTLSLAQEIVAVEAGYETWADLKMATADRPKTPRPPAGEPVMRSVVPILPVRDVTRSAAFFEQSLGFDIDFLHGSPAFYGAVSRDTVCVHLRHVGKPVFAELAARETSLITASFEVSNVQGLFEEFSARGVVFAQPLMKHPWGGTDFHVGDPDGNVVSFVSYG